MCLTTAPNGGGNAYFHCSFESAATLTAASTAAIDEEQAPAERGAWLPRWAPWVGGRHAPGPRGRHARSRRAASGLAGHGNASRPLVVIAAVMGLILFMGWHRELTAENIVALRDRFHHVLAEHRRGVRACLRGGLCSPGRPQPARLSDRDRDGRIDVRLAGRRCGRRGRRDDGRHPPVPDRALGDGRDAERAGSPLAHQAAAGLQGGRAELSAVPAPCSGLSLLVCQYRAGHPRRSPQDLRDRNVFRYHPCHLRLRVGGCRPRQRHHGREGRVRAVRGRGRRRCLQAHASMPARSSPGSCCWRCCFWASSRSFLSLSGDGGTAMQQPSDRAVGLVRVRPGDDRAARDRRTEERRDHRHSAAARCAPTCA